MNEKNNGESSVNRCRVGSKNKLRDRRGLPCRIQREWFSLMTGKSRNVDTLFLMMEHRVGLDEVWIEM